VKTPKHGEDRPSLRTRGIEIEAFGEIPERKSHSSERIRESGNPRDSVDKRFTVEGHFDIRNKRPHINIPRKIRIGLWSYKGGRVD
jgi:hypothetical protein